VTLEEVQELFAFHRWANALLLDAAGGLSAEDFARNLGSSFPSVRETLVHLLSADWIWLERWHARLPLKTAQPPLAAPPASFPLSTCSCRTNSR
jgi:uncharacterized damage-inducible protein DinB